MEKDIKALKWLEGSELGYDVWEKKYRFNNESFDEWLDRLSNGDEKVRKLIEEKKFLYGGRILANLNTGNGQGLSNCTTFSYVEDSLDDIMDTAKNLAISYKKEAGVGIALSKIRPKGASIGGNHKSDGIIGFLKIFNSVTENVKRGGARRGAMLVGLHCDHPDIFDFINIKKQNKGTDGEVTSANLSVLVTDEFMEHYIKGESYRKDFVVEATGEVIPHIVDTVKIINAIVDTPKTAFEPGIIFVDRYKEGHLFGSVYGDKELMCNACSEFYGAKGTVCLLGSINLSSYVVEDFGNTYFDFDKFSKDVKICIKALDKAHDYGIGKNGLKIQNDRAEQYRGIGLGIMGLADMFIKLGIRYGSKESVILSEKIAKIMRESSIEESIQLGKELGQPKGILEDEKKLEDMGLPYIKGLRNNSLLSIAPAGSISLIANVSTGIEPVFRTSYVRKTESLNNTDTYYTVYHKAIQDVIDRFGYKPDYCIDTRDITVHEKVDVIAAWQKYVDLSISNTTNFKENATVEEIRELYRYGWEKGVKGLTVYVDGSIEGVLNDVGKKEETTELKRGEIAKKPDSLVGERVEINHGCGKYTLHIYKDTNTGKVFDCWINSKTNGCISNVQSLAVTISLLLRAGVDLDRISTAISGVGACPSFMVGKSQGRCSEGKSCGTAIITALKKAQGNIKPEIKKVEKIETKDTLKQNKKIDNKYICPECGAVLHPLGGCFSCECGFTKCE